MIDTVRLIGVDFSGVGCITPREQMKKALTDPLPAGFARGLVGSLTRIYCSSSLPRTIEGYDLTGCYLQFAGTTQGHVVRDCFFSCVGAETAPAALYVPGNVAPGLLVENCTFDGEGVGRSPMISLGNEGSELRFLDITRTPQDGIALGHKTVGGSSGRIHSSRIHGCGLPTSHTDSIVIYSASAAGWVIEDMLIEVTGDHLPAGIAQSDWPLNNAALRISDGSSAPVAGVIDYRNSVIVSQSNRPDTTNGFMIHDARPVGSTPVLRCVGNYASDMFGAGSYGCWGVRHPDSIPAIEHRDWRSVCQPRLSV